MFEHYKFTVEITEASKNMMIKALYLTFITPTLCSGHILMGINVLTLLWEYGYKVKMFFVVQKKNV